MVQRHTVSDDQRDKEEAREAPAPPSPALDILTLQRTVGNAAVSRAIAARQPAAAATMTPEEELEKAFFDDDWDRIVALCSTRTTPAAIKRITGLDMDELRYLDDAIRRADQERSQLAKVVKSQFDAKKVPEKQQAPGAGYGKVEFKNTSIKDGSRKRPPQERELRVRDQVHARLPDDRERRGDRLHPERAGGGPRHRREPSVQRQ